jgi:hypothetical protein
MYRRSRKIYIRIYFPVRVASLAGLQAIYIALVLFCISACTRGKSASLISPHVESATYTEVNGMYPSCVFIVGRYLKDLGKMGTSRLPNVRSTMFWCGCHGKHETDGSHQLTKSINAAMLRRWLRTKRTSELLVQDHECAWNLPK